MTGPPTPPPSSATEIEDAARTSIPPPLAQAEAQPDTEAQPTPEAPPSETTAQQSPPEAAPQPAQQTAYELLFPSIAELARSGSLKELVQVAERADLSVRLFTQVYAHTRTAF